MAETWKTSSRCVGNNHCVEVAVATDVLVRDRAGTVLRLGRRSWQQFVGWLRG